MMRLLCLLVLTILFLQSCNRRNEECAFVPDTDAIPVDLVVEHLEDSIAGFTSKQQLVDFFSRHPVMRDNFFSRSAYPSDSMFINELYNRFTNPYFDSLLLETHKKFGDFSEIKNEFQQAFKNFTYYYPGFLPPKVQTVISGLETDLFVSDSLIIIGLDYYMGPGAKYRPNMHEYILRRYQKNFIVPSVLLLYGIGDRYNATNLEDRTVLAEMITYGKAYYFAKQMLPCVPDSVFIGYTREEIEGSRNNLDLIWKRFIEDEVLYATTHLVKQKYIGERPKTIEVGEKCPGRIGTWVGWEIVKKYMDNSEVTLPQLMQTAEGKEIFARSKFRPL